MTASKARVPELLSPAGNREKLEAAVNFGADAVYLAGKAFGMRAAADNFTLPEMDDAIAFAHARGVKVYVTVNTMPRTSEYPELRRYLSALRELKPDALICSDIGVMAEVGRLLPGTPMHVSTQASAVSAAACEAYRSLGASRVVLAHELTLAEIREIREAVSPSLELEVFVHGSMCVSMSGMCLLSAHLAGRDANSGSCTQPCRWNWRAVRQAPECEIEEAKHPGERYIAREDEFGTFIMSARDLNMIAHVGELANAGIASLKIEGRVKSAFYAAVTANAYRIALDDFAAGRPLDPALSAELDSVSHREYGEGWFYGRPSLCTADGYLREKAYLATALTSAKAGEPCVFVQRNKLSSGERAELLTPGRTGQPFTVGPLFDADGLPIPSAPHPAMRFSTALPFDVKAGDILRGG